jgi:hypothetical protein
MRRRSFVQDRLDLGDQFITMPRRKALLAKRGSPPISSRPMAPQKRANLVVAECQSDRIVGSVKRPIPGNHRITTASAPLQFARAQVRGQLGCTQPDHRLHKGYIEVMTSASALAIKQRCHDSERGIHSGEHVGRRGVYLLRSGLRLTGQVHNAADGRLRR